MSGSDVDSGSELGEPTEELFAAAAAYVARRAKSIESRDLLQFYGLYKQATEGVCRVPRPSMVQIKARSKWQAWQELNDMTQTDAQSAYIKKLEKMEPDWQSDNTGPNKDHPLSGWVVHSIESMPEDDNPTPEHLKTIFDHVKEHNLQRLRAELKPSDLTPLDEQGMALLHWATDRNAIDIIEYLIESGANVNQLDAEQQTPLHYAASCGHIEVLRYLLSQNADIELKDSTGQTCLDVADDEQIYALLHAERQLRSTSSAN